MSDRKFLLYISVFLLLLTAGFFPAMPQQNETLMNSLQDSCCFSDSDRTGNSKEFLPVSGVWWINSNLPGNSKHEFNHQIMHSLPPCRNTAEVQLKYQLRNKNFTETVFIREISKKSVSGRAGPFHC